MIISAAKPLTMPLTTFHSWRPQYLLQLKSRQRASNAREVMQAYTQADAKQPLLKQFCNLHLMSSTLFECLPDVHMWHAVHFCARQPVTKH